MDQSRILLPHLFVPSATGILLRGKSRGLKEWAEERILTVKDEDLQKCILPGTSTAYFKQTASWGWVVGTWDSLRVLGPQKQVFHTLPNLECKPVGKTFLQITTSFLKELTLPETCWVSGYKKVGWEEFKKRALGRLEHSAE